MKRVELRPDVYALVDDDDFDEVAGAGKWHLSICDGHPYARRIFTIGKATISVSMHSFITGWKIVDHINGDGLDNRRSNLRPATASQNSSNMRKPSHNTSGFKGVSFHKPSGLWKAYIQVQGRRLSLRYHKTPEQAARAYDVAAREHFGEFARLNFPNEGEQAA